MLSLACQVIAYSSPPGQKNPRMSEFVFHTNRASAIFFAALAPLGGRKFGATDRHIDLLYFDGYGGKTPPDDVTVGFHLIDRQRTIPLDNKAKMAALLLAAGINYPRVYFDPAAVPQETETLWFIKDPMLTAGKGIQVVRSWEIADSFRPGCIIQEAVQDLLLIQQRKFTLRAYVLVNRGQLYLFPEAISVMHGADYEPLSQEPRVQFDHIGYMSAESPVEMRPFRELSASDIVMDNLAAEMQTVFGAFRDLLRFEKAHTYCLFGIDVLVKADLGTVLIEINDRPNLMHRKEINERVNIPLVRALCCILEPARSASLTSDAPQFELIAAL